MATVGRAIGVPLAVNAVAKVVRVDRVVDDGAAEAMRRLPDLLKQLEFVFLTCSVQTHLLKCDDDVLSKIIYQNFDSKLIIITFFSLH